MLGLRIISPTTGTGDRGGDRLLARIRAIVQELAPARYRPDAKVGFAGDIPNAIAEKESIAGEAFGATSVAFVLILAGVVVFFRSPWSLIVISLPAFIGVGCAYSFAMAAYGYVNTSGAFLGAIILGECASTTQSYGCLHGIANFAPVGKRRTRLRRRAAGLWNAFSRKSSSARWWVSSIAHGSLGHHAISRGRTSLP